jgi:hypothetical protein
MGWRIRALSGLILVLVGALTGGCVTSRPMLNVTYHSDPEGATIYEGERLLGSTPITFNYPAAEARFRAGQCLTLLPTKARWVSGVTVESGLMRVCPGNTPNQQHVFIRPMGAPGIDLDVNYALQSQANAIQAQRNGVMQQQADAQDATAVAEFLRSQNAASHSRASQ